MEQLEHPEGVFGRDAAALRAALLQPFLRLNFVTLWVRDQERSRRFFMEKLDFETIDLAAPMSWPTVPSTCPTRPQPVLRSGCNSPVDVQTPEGGRWIV